MIYVFRKYESSEQIVIYAESYLEAKNALFELNGLADKIYNILEFKTYKVDLDKYSELFNLSYNDLSYSRFLSNSEFEKLRGEQVFIDETFKNIHNTHVLCKSDFTEEQSVYNVSTNEYINMLKENVVNAEYIKKSINKMLNKVGDIWYIEYQVPYPYSQTNMTYYIYGISRKQCLDMFNKIHTKIKPAPNYYNYKIKLLIGGENDLYSLINYDYTQKDVSNYNTLVGFMKKFNIKKFPFNTYEYLNDE